MPFGRLPEEVIARVVDKFVLQLEAQLADRNVTIELTDEARNWLVKNGYDESMGARPMARVIQTQIKTQLADEVLFGKLKGGGVVRVVVTSDEDGKKKLGFVFPEGPATPGRRTRRRGRGQEAAGQEGRGGGGLGPPPLMAARRRPRWRRRHLPVERRRAKGPIAGNAVCATTALDGEPAACPSALAKVRSDGKRPRVDQRDSIKPLVGPGAEPRAPSRRNRFSSRGECPNCAL